jgi:nitroreductase
METWEAIRARRNVRTYQDRHIQARDRDRRLEAGRRTPTASNRQPWDFVLVTDRSQLQNLTTVWMGARHLAMMLAATDLGVGSGHSAIGDQEACRRILGIPDDRICAYMLALGYPADRPLQPISSPDRRPFEDVVHRDHW